MKRDGEIWSLLSRKESGDYPAIHDKLEMLGGRLEAGEAPRAALLRELSEEEASGGLARIAAQREPDYASRVADGALHHLFELVVEPAEVEGLRHDPEESLGFEWLRSRDLDSGALDSRLTPRTKQILVAFGPSRAG